MPIKYSLECSQLRCNYQNCPENFSTRDSFSVPNSSKDDLKLHRLGPGIALFKGKEKFKMNSNLKSKGKTAMETSMSTVKKSTESKMPTLGGISLPEIAVLGAAGFVLWKNREKISTLLEDNGINVPSFLNSDISDLIQSGVSMLGNQATSKNTTARRHDA
jgi:hypothetical protein